MATNYYSINSLDKDPKLAMAIGNMVLAWANAEVTLFSTLARVSGMGLNQSMSGYYRIPTLESRVKFICALMDDWKADGFDKEEIKTAVIKLSKLASTRNHWVHGDWCATQDFSEIVVFDQRAALDAAHRKKPIKAHDVEHHCATVISRTGTLSKLIKRQELEA